MAKRFIYHQQYGERKKSRLDISISDHNFPLSQNKESKDVHEKQWGDDNEDEILLLASQACEQAYSNDSMLPDYSLCMQPTTTSTQMLEPSPSTSKAGFVFKKPTTNPCSTISTSLRDKCSRISSPLPGLPSKVHPKIEQTNLTDDLVFNDKIFNNHDSDFAYKQLLHLQEENTKLKSENGKLLDKCVTKEGEASILRTQLKTTQVAVDNARLERVKAQEKMQIEWTEKLNAVKKQMHDLSTQLDFKNLEIISIKERCRMLESNKVKLTQVTVAHNDITSSSHRNSSIANQNESYNQRRAKMTSSSMQTDEDRALLLKLNSNCNIETTNLQDMLPYILSPNKEQRCILDYNEKLQQNSMDLSQNKCRIFSTFHRLPSTPVVKEVRKSVEYNMVCQLLTNIAMGDLDGNVDQVLTSIGVVLEEVHDHLDSVSKRISTAFQKEMDERYMEATNTCLIVRKTDLLGGNALYQEEQAVLARRLISILACMLENSKIMYIFTNFENANRRKHKAIIQAISKICNLIDRVSCGVLFSGLLLSITNLICVLAITKDSGNIIRSILRCRPMPFVGLSLLSAVRILSLDREMPLCPGTSAAHLPLDNEQGVLLFKKDSCHLQIFIKQVEVLVKCVERQRLSKEATSLAQNLLALSSNIDSTHHINKDTIRCECRLVLFQVLVYTLRVCAVLLKSSEESERAGGVCRSGVQRLHSRWVRAAAPLAPSHYDGHLLDFCHMFAQRSHLDIYGTMISELTSPFQSSMEDSPPFLHKQPLLNSFQKFSISE